ncbi:MAG: hypothetical protein U1B30_03910, partial [Pseudomonadota bacterium]|nr:hypothetical protein [Pseudomonadota bacterium]
MAIRTKESPLMQLQHRPGPLIHRLMIGLIVMGQLLLSQSHADNYTIQSLGKDFIPISISNAGLIVGKNGVDGTITTQNTANSGTTTANLGATNEATQINDSNVIVGYTKTVPTVATLWEKNILSLELTRFSNLLKATAINGFNEIAGTRLDSSSSYRRPYHY